MKLRCYRSKCFVTRIESPFNSPNYVVTVENGMHDFFEFKMDKSDYEKLAPVINQKVIVSLEIHDETPEHVDEN